jgi:hypothetical protein
MVVSESPRFVFGSVALKQNEKEPNEALEPSNRIAQFER